MRQLRAQRRVRATAPPPRYRIGRPQNGPKVRRLREAVIIQTCDNGHIGGVLYSCIFEKTPITCFAFCFMIVKKLPFGSGHPEHIGGGGIFRRASRDHCHDFEL